MSIKVVYNACFGGYSLSQKALERLAQLGIDQSELDSCYLHDLPRHDPRLVQVVEELGEEANGGYADLKIHFLEGIRYRIDEYDGSESVQEPKDISWIVVEN